MAREPAVRLISVVAFLSFIFLLPTGIVGLSSVASPTAGPVQGPIGGPASLGSSPPVRALSMASLPATPSSPGPVAPAILRPSTSAPSSDLIETPLPAIPTTLPTTYIIASKLVCPPACTPMMNVTAPGGPWSLILLNFTGSVVPGVYDSSYHAEVNGVPIFFGTTPELNTWTVLKDLTEYSALFSGTALFQFALGQATIGGHFVLNVTLSFYPIPVGSTPPIVPSAIVPLWSFTSLSNSRTQATVNASVPADVQNATLELYSYGFSNNAYDEFWYSGSAGLPAYRAIGVTVDGLPLATVQPFEYVNTGGLDLYLWDPVTGAYTANDVPYEVDVTAALGFLEGSHTFNATVVGRESGSSWFVGGSLLLYTNASYTGASLVSDPAPSQSYSNGTSTTRGVPPPETVTRSYTYASDLLTANGTELVEAWTNETFRSTFPVGPNPNETGAVVNAFTAFHQVSLAPWGDAWRNDTSSPSIAFESGSVFIQSSTTNGGYPIYGNVTQTMYWLYQNWNLTSTGTEAPTHGPRTTSATYSNDNVTSNGMYSGAEKEISQAAAELLGISTFWSNTTKTYSSFEVASPLTASFRHTMTSQLSPADLSTNVASVLANTVQYSDGSALQASTASTDVGQPNTLSVRTLGYGAPFSYSWSGLPAGCTASSTQSKVVCRAATAKSYVVSVDATSVFGQAAPGVSATWTVYPDPSLSVVIKPGVLDLGRPTNLTVIPVGGLAPFKCTWTANGVPIGPAGSCPRSFVYDAAALGVINVTVNLTDSLGFVVDNGSMLTVEAVPTALLEFTNPSSSAVPTIAVGDTLVFNTVIVGGVAPFLYRWFINDGSLGTASSVANFSYQPTSAGNATISVEVTDSDGITVTSAGVVVDVTTIPGGGNPGGGGGGGGTSSSVGTDALVGVGIVGVGVILLLVILMNRRNRSPPKS